MIVKKSPQANLENKRLPLFFLGILFATAIVLTAFEWRTFEEVTVLPETGLPLYLDDEQIFTAVVQKEKLKAPEPRKANPDILNIVETMTEPEPEVLFPDIDEPIIYDIEPIGESLAPEEKIFRIVEEMPEFPGGESARGNYMKNTLRYPSAPLNMGISGTVYVSFIVNKKGEIEEVFVLQGVHPDLDAEAMRVIKSMPVWKPGMQRGVPVKVQFSVPIKFSARR